MRKSIPDENLCATVNGEILATTPDLICLVDTETFTPVPTDALKYGKRVLGRLAFRVTTCGAPRRALSWLDRAISA